VVAEVDQILFTLQIQQVELVVEVQVEQIMEVVLEMQEQEEQI